MSKEEIPPPDPVNMEEEDELVRIQDESPADLVAPVQPPQLNVQKAEHSGRGQQNNSVMLAPPLGNRTFVELFDQLSHKEISAVIEQLDPSEYLALIFMYLIQNNPVEARFAIVRAVERQKSSSLFIQLADISSSLCENNVSRALAELNKINADPSFGPYVTELKNRLTALRLKQILRAYSTISIESFIKALGYAGQSNVIEEILTQLQWTVDQGYIVPTETEACRQMINTAQKAEFGPDFASVEAGNGEKKEKLSAEALQRLVKFAEFLDRPL